MHNQLIPTLRVEALELKKGIWKRFRITKTNMATGGTINLK